MLMMMGCCCCSCDGILHVLKEATYIYTYIVANNFNDMQAACNNNNQLSTLYTIRVFMR